MTVLSITVRRNSETGQLELSGNTPTNMVALQLLLAGVYSLGHKMDKETKEKNGEGGDRPHSGLIVPRHLFNP